MIERIPLFEVVEQRLDRDPGTRNTTAPLITASERVTRTLGTAISVLVYRNCKPDALERCG